MRKYGDHAHTYIHNLPPSLATSLWKSMIERLWQVYWYWSKSTEPIYTGSIHSICAALHFSPYTCTWNSTRNLHHKLLLHNVSIIKSLVSSEYRENVALRLPASITEWHVLHNSQEKKTQRISSNPNTYLSNVWKWHQKSCYIVLFVYVYFLTLDTTGPWTVAMGVDGSSQLVDSPCLATKL